MDSRGHHVVYMVVKPVSTVVTVDRTAVYEISLIPFELSDLVEVTIDVT